MILLVYKSNRIENFNFILGISN